MPADNDLSRPSGGALRQAQISGMSIRIENIHVPASFPGAGERLFRGLSIEIPDGARVGILGAAKSGKTTLLRLMCGTLVPDRGLVKRTSTVSWPIPLATFLAPNATVARSIRFIARLYGVSDEHFPRRVAEMVDIGEFLNTPIAKCPKFVKPRLAFALGIGMEFDVYLFDGAFPPVDKEFKQKASEIIAGRTQGRGFVLASAAPSEAEKSCDSVYVLESQQARFFANAKEGLEYFKQLLAAEKQKQVVEEGKKAEADQDEADTVGDMDIMVAAIADEL
jgi:capsular polysaccharide transport system ATP-binding protein